MANKTTTQALIPLGGSHITEAQYPKGFYVASYDRDGFTTSPRWFPTFDAAQAYATQLGNT